MGGRDDAAGICWDRVAKPLDMKKLGGLLGFYISILIARMDIACVSRKKPHIGIRKSSAARFEEEAECQAFHPPPYHYAGKVFLSGFHQVPIFATVDIT